MKVGDLIQWLEYREKQYVPLKTKRIGVISALGFHEKRNNINRVYVLANNGDHVIIHKDSSNYKTIEVLNGNR